MKILARIISVLAAISAISITITGAAMSMICLNKFSNYNNPKENNIK